MMRAPESSVTADDYGPPVYPSLEAIARLLETWQVEHPDVMQLEVCGRSREARPIYAIRLTDPGEPDENKEHVFVTCLHSGVERSATTSSLCLLEWLLSGDGSAREILRRQVLVFMPVPNPDCYLRGEHGSVYHGWTLSGPNDPENNPEGLAVKQIMDELQPELHADLHGLSLDFERYTMLENSGASYSNLGLRCHKREIAPLMDAAALAEGYSSDHGESDSERLFWGPELDGMKDKLWSGRPRVYAALYCHNRYHTLLTASEVYWERSGLLRHRRLFEIGNEVWPGEHYAGYPTRVVCANHYHMVTAYGRTAAARRRSRVELWSKLPQLAQGMVDPMVSGKLVYVCSATAAAAGRWLAPGPLADWADKLSDHGNIDAEPIRRFVAGWPQGQNHPEAFLHIWRSSGDGQTASTPIQHGLCLRLRIFWPNAEVTDLRLNGYPVVLSETDGYTLWRDRGITFVQVNIPPERSRVEDLYIVTCTYDPGEEREHWQGWRRVE